MSLSFVFQNKVTASDAIAFPKDFEHLEKIYQKIDDTNLVSKIVSELTINGFSPHGGVAYTIPSDNERWIEILMYDVDLKNDQLVDDIRDVVAGVIQENNFDPFEISIKVVKR